ncbi:DUF4320 family protein [Thermocaproicibacter melissae]|uniref:DUF4320 family protein n=1 Tax=Thermocaproicibacter melissae TaxID=2966552 RepID=UPI0024B0E9A9|nr:DUF4320 family protein [Thermocaproicibacter melissae]WBY64706.1 DUF4320 family protein [Thermocaproicibacter melissae]
MIHKLLKDKRGGVDQYVSAVIAMLTLLALFVMISAGMKAMNAYNTLNDFGNELAVTVGNEGRCSGERVSTRYNELVSATGITPNVEYTAEYVDSEARTVQYGDTITLRLSMQTSISALKISIPISLSITKSVTSQQYWK